MSDNRTLNEVLGKLDVLRQQFNAEQLAHFNHIKFLLQQTVPKLMKRHNIKSFGWTQYTPYFMDGETCYFGVNLDEYGCRVRIGDLGEEERIEELSSDISEDTIAIVYEILDIFSKIPTEWFETMFGDHVEVSIMDTGEFIVSDYNNHD